MRDAGWRIGFIVLAATSVLGAENLEIRDNLPVVSVHVNGQGPYRFLLDTGAQYTHLDLALAKTLGLTPSARTEIVSASSTVQAVAARGVEIAVGPEKAPGQTVVLSKLESARELGRDIRGVLGQEFLSRFDYLIDLKHKRIEFGPRSWTGSRTAFEFVHDRPVIQTSLGRLILDSGAAVVIVFGDTGPRKTDFVLTMTGSAPATRVPHKPLTIEGRRIHYDDLFSASGGNETDVDGLLPAHLFKNLYVSNSQRYVGFDGP